MGYGASISVGWMTVEAINFIEDTSRYLQLCRGYIICRVMSDGSRCIVRGPAYRRHCVPAEVNCMQFAPIMVFEKTSERRPRRVVGGVSGWQVATWRVRPGSIARRRWYGACGGDRTVPGTSGPSLAAAGQRYLYVYGDTHNGLRMTRATAGSSSSRRLFAGVANLWTFICETAHNTVRLHMSHCMFTATHALCEIKHDCIKQFEL